MLYQIVDGTLSAGSETVLSHFNFEIRGRQRIAVVGPNGAGKTTLLRLIAGELTLDRDDRQTVPPLKVMGNPVIGILHQQAFEDGERMLHEEMMSICPFKDTWDRERFDFEQEYDRLLTGFGFVKQDKQKRIGEFSGGQQTKLAFIRLLLLKPDILLLDEPTNHLDMETAEWLEAYLKNYPGAIVMVSHDRFFLDETAEIVYELSDGQLTKYTGNYSAYRVQKRKQFQIRKKQYEQQQAEIARLNELIERFKHKPKKAAMARSKKKVIERMAKIDPPGTEGTHLFTGEMTPENQGPKCILEAEKLGIGYDHVLMELSLRIRRGQKIGIIGPNGAGKTTFLKTAAGMLMPLKGKIQTGQGVMQGYFDQMSGSLVSEETVIGYFHSRFPSLTDKEARQYLAAFLFRGADCAHKVSDLSGGEKSRLAMAVMLKELPNFLIMDEPTNHMDIPAKETLESAFKAYTGTILFVSHDRYFISEVADALLIFEDGEAYYYPFDYRHYLHHMAVLAQRRALEENGVPETEKKDREVMIRVSAQDQLLIDGLMHVPKGSSLLGREPGTDEAFLEWQQRLAAEAMAEAAEKAENERIKAGERYRACLTSEGISWMSESDEAPLKTAEEQLLEAELKWYEIWDERHPEIIPEKEESIQIDK